MALSTLEKSILRRVKQLLKSKEETYICHALSSIRARSSGDIRLVQACYRLEFYIQERLGGLDSLKTWQNNRGIYLSESQIRKDRIAWIDWMLNEEGD